MTLARLFAGPGPGLSSRTLSSANVIRAHARALKVTCSERTQARARVTRKSSFVCAHNTRSVCQAFHRTQTSYTGISTCIGIGIAVDVVVVRPCRRGARTIESTEPYMLKHNTRNTPPNLNSVLYFVDYVSEI